MTESNAQVPGSVLNEGPRSSSVDVQSAAFARFEPLIRAVHLQSLLLINIDVGHAVTVALGAMPRVKELRPAMVGLGSSINLALIDNVEGLAYALAHANDDFLQSTTASDSLPVLIEPGMRLRDLKEVAASTLVRQQAFTLFVKAYDEVRRAVSFLRWKERDADTIAPSLYGARNGTRARQDEPTLPEAPIA